MIDLEYIVLREQQKRIIDDIAQSSQKYHSVRANTGIGKSIIPMMDNHKTWIVTSSFNLTQQYMNDFPQLKEIKGAANFDCLIADRNCKQCPNRKGRCHDCPYLIQFNEGIANSKTVMNSAYFWNYILNVENGKINRGNLYIDEAHKMINDVKSVLDFSIPKKVLNEKTLDFIHQLNKNKFTGFYAKNNNLLETLQIHLGHIHATIDIDEIRKELEKYYIYRSNQDDLVDEKYKLLKRYYWNHQEFFPLENDNYINFKILDESKIFDFVKEYLKNFNKVIFMSGSLDYLKFGEIFGGYKKYFSNDWDINKRAIVGWGGIKLNFKSTPNDYQRKVDEIEKILERYDGQKGLIHTPSYKLANIIAKNLNWSGKIFTHNSHNRLEVIEAFKNYDAGAVLISPFIYEGLDFKDDLARFNIVAKIPYPVVTSNYEKFFKLKNVDWYNEQWLHQLEQSYGRGVRNKLDFCDFYLLDGFPIWLNNSLERICPYLNEALEKRDEKIAKYISKENQ